MRLFLMASACCLASGAFAADVVQLPLASNYCAILRAFTQATDARCPQPADLGQTRSVAVADSDGLVEEAGYFIRFALNSDVVTEAYQSHLDQLAKVLGSDATRDLCLRIVGHADTSGAEAHNLALSQRRARAVQLYLIGVRNMDAARISSVGKGEGEPLPNMSGTDPLNRRVEMLAKPADGGSCS